MADRFKPINHLGNTNLLPNKNTKITVAAAILMLLTAACSLGNYDIPNITIYCVSPLLLILGVYATTGLASAFKKRVGNDWPHVPKLKN